MILSLRHYGIGSGMQAPLVNCEGWLAQADEMMTYACGNSFGKIIIKQCVFG